MPKSKRSETPAPIAGPALLMLRESQCKTHPKNMRRFYPVADVRQMAESIRANKGLIHALIALDSGDSTFTIVDGNMRLAGARLLGADCPLLKAEVVSQDQAEQYLTMAAANTVRFDVDPISEALHYQRLLAEGLSRLDIAQRSGTYITRVAMRLKLLQLDPSLQELVAAGMMPCDPDVAEALCAIPDVEMRVKLATRLSEQKATNKAYILAAKQLLERLADPRSNVNRKRRGRPTSKPHPSQPAGMIPALALSQDRTGYGIPNNNRPGWPAVRAAARQMCHTCDIKTETLRETVDEPAWTLISHAAGATCEACNVREVAGACNGCPGVELLSRLLRGAHAKTPHVGETAPTERRI